MHKDSIARAIKEWLRRLLWLGTMLSEKSLGMTLKKARMKVGLITTSNAEAVATSKPLKNGNKNAVLSVKHETQSIHIGGDISCP